MNILIIYLIAAALTSLFAAYKTGEEQAHMRALQPTQIMQVNWINCFFQGLLWFAYWAQALSYWKIARVSLKNPAGGCQAAMNFFGIKEN
jgi:hypothetical protein